MGLFGGDKKEKSQTDQTAQPNETENEVKIPEVNLEESQSEVPELKEKAGKVARENAGVVELDEKDLDTGELLKNIITTALEYKASDIHIEPRETDVEVRFRIDGMLQIIDKLEKRLEKSLIFKVKVASKLRTDEHFAPQDGRIRFILRDTTVDVRVSIVPISTGEKIVMRLLTQHGKDFALSDLGMVDRDLQIVEKNYIKPYGMVIATGPTGSGKTTTLYSILKIINTPEKNITTIEDPVEYDIVGVNHIQVNKKADLTFANGLRSVLRQDPDVIMIGEIRDTETANIAINAALTGHLVLSTMHTNDSITTIPRLMDMGVEGYLVADTLTVVMAQRLARTLCEDCKKEYTIPTEEYEKLKMIRPDISALVKPSAKLYQTGGCDKCRNSGYRGRIGLYEVFEMNEEIRELINAKAAGDEIFEQARKDGLTLIVEDGVKKLLDGNIDMKELIRVTAIRE